MGQCNCTSPRRPLARPALPLTGEGVEHVQPLLSAIKWESSVCNQIAWGDSDGRHAPLETLRSRRARSCARPRFGVGAGQDLRAKTVALGAAVASVAESH